MPIATTPPWHDEVPGTRWFRADLHVHTIDDHDGGRITVPPALGGGNLQDPSALRQYGRAVLDSAIARGVEVLGLTPHDVRTGPSTSATWAVVEAWLNDSNADGRPYRELVYAVFPGFEPSLNVGSRGLHLAFLFDPTIGLDRYQRIFDALMGGVRPWQDGQLRISNLDEKRFFEVLDDFHRRENGAPGSDDRWEYLLLTPHAFNDNGLFGALKAQALQMFPSERLSGLELGDNQLPPDVTANRPWLEPAMRRLRHAFYHASDAYRLTDDPSVDDLYFLGSRVTLTKLNVPTITALRQCLLADESRVRLAYEKNDAGEMVARRELPDACPQTRPWMRRVSVAGGTSFLRDQQFAFSPDLTCIIGGSMTGKSTLLDGLRYLFGGEQGLPDERTSLGAGVHARAKQQFMSGNPRVVLESPAGDVSRSVVERFQVRFFSQAELKTLSEDDEGIEHLLFHLVPGRANALLQQRNGLREYDEGLASAVGRLTKLQEQVEEAEQAFKRTSDAQTAMERFAQAGTAELPPAQQDAARTGEFQKAVASRLQSARSLHGEIDGLSLPNLNTQAIATLLEADTEGPSAQELMASARSSAETVVRALDALQAKAQKTTQAAKQHLSDVTAKVQAALVDAGGSAEDLNQFEAYSRAARHFDSFKAAYEQKVAERDKELDRYNQLVQERDQLVVQHRSDVRDVCAEVAERFQDRVRVDIQEGGRKAPLDAWLRDMRAKGVTQWWNGGGSQQATATSIVAIVDALANQRHDDAIRIAGGIGMSDAVASSFLEQLAPWSRQLEARAIRTPDRYLIHWVEDGEPKILDDLSGGRKVAVLLSLILESDDPTPLVVDQPEDELDNRFLNDTIIPALHRLKGKRQVIFATHNANIVVNGDADQVIALEADAQHGTVYASGAIENPDIREAILKTLDGGEDAFRLRRAKYGF